mgnify:CR=1 FL=1
MKFRLVLIILLVNFSFVNSAEKTVDQNSIHKNLRCLVCQGQSIADSNSDFAQTIKLVVKNLIEDGKTEDEIYSFMVDKYGDWIVYNPPFNKTNFLLWSIPYLVFLIGGFIIFTFFQKNKPNQR